MLELWAPADARVEFPDMNRATFERFVDDFFAIGPSLLLVGNVIVDFQDAEHASGVVYCWPQLELDGTMIDQAVVYRDAYVRRDDDWRFQTRRHILIHGQARERNPLDQPPADWPRSQVGRGLGLR
jgi:SnoaL-like domain